MMLKPVSTPDAPAAIGPYSQAIVHGGLVWCSGQVAFDPATGQLIQGDVEDETRQVLKNLTAVLDAAGSGLHKVIRATVFLKDMNDFGAVNAKIEAHLKRGGHVLVHCHASLSRSAAYLLAYLMWSRKLTLLEAAQLMKPKWDATWPNDRFVFQLMEYERDLEKPHRLATSGLLAVFGAGALVGFALAVLLALA